VTASLPLIWMLLVLVAAGWLAAFLAVRLSLSLCDDGRYEPAARVRRVFLVALLPWIVPLAFLGAALMPAAGKAFGLIADHCLSHGASHPHLCLEHLPVIALTHWHWLVMGLLMAWFAYRVSRHVASERRMGFRLQTMASLARGGGRMRILDMDECAAFAIHPGQPLILMSRGLIEKLSLRERRVVLAHEVAHLRHRDPARSRLLDRLLLLHERTAAVRLRRAWQQAIEERSDEAVAKRFGAEEVAATIVKVARVVSGRDTPVLSAAGADTVRRIERLLAERRPTAGNDRYEIAYGAALLLVVVVVAASHHWLETLLGTLA